MNHWFIYIIILYVCIILPMYRRKKAAAHHVMRKRKAKMTKEERMKMYELLKRFIGKKCNISIMNSSAGILGKITEVQDNWIIVDTNNNGNDAINIDYITKVSEWPAPKEKKKKKAE